MLPEQATATIERPRCGALPPNVGGPVPCHLDPGHERDGEQHFSTTGCAGSEIRWGDPLRVYIDLADWWIGYYRGPNHHYVLLIPTVVIRWRRRDARENR